MNQNEGCAGCWRGAEVLWATVRPLKVSSLAGALAYLWEWDRGAI